MSMDEHDVARLNAPQVSQEAQCRECDGDLFQVGSFYACQEPACSRYAVPVNEYGNTDAEQDAEDEKAGEAWADRHASYRESPSYRDAMADAGRGHLLP